MSHTQAKPGKKERHSSPRLNSGGRRSCGCKRNGGLTKRDGCLLRGPLKLRTCRSHQRTGDRGGETNNGWWRWLVRRLSGSAFRASADLRRHVSSNHPTEKNGAEADRVIRELLCDRPLVPHTSQASFRLCVGWKQGIRAEGFGDSSRVFQRREARVMPARRPSRGERDDVGEADRSVGWQRMCGAIRRDHLEMEQRI
ncbi:hypothetical protein B296_00055793 [Ensete ventricosum]|uniref:Uncharacterized protein n=1 Tax=Ensete ventricosum TaxID=4639 RepID=A0A426X4M9_ENSVE|nr:hypothetical protein B296_00055793 [Ensete ventricosum]